MMLAPLLLTDSASGAFASGAVEIIAHRGASHEAPENTLASFGLGWEQGAGAGELDIHLSRDRQIVVIHDLNTRRTTGVDKPVAEQTLAELRALDAGAWKGARWAGEKIPTLSEALATIPEGRRMFVEIKCGVDVLPELERVIRTSAKKPEQIALIGFSYAVARAAKVHFPGLEVLWLASYRKGADEKFPTAAELVEKAKAAHLDGLDLDFRFPIDAAFAAEVKGAGLKLYAWTVDDLTRARDLVAAGVDGITTNRPAWLREQIK